MNKFMKKLMKKDGFTLVELIVVIAILAILAGVAVPAYSGYINKAQEAGLITELDAIATAAQAANATKGEITGITVVANGNSGIKVTVTAANGLATSYDKDFVLFYDDAVADSTTTDQGDFTVADIKLVGKYAEKAEDKIGYIVSAGATWSSDGWTEGVVEKDESHTCTYVADAQTGEHKCACGESHASTEKVSGCTVCNPPAANS